MNRFCTSCGRRVQTGAIYCGICGAPLTPASGPETRPRKPIRAFVGLGIAAIVIIVGGLTWGSIANPIFDPAPPGKIVQQLRASLTGKWPPEIAVLSKTAEPDTDPQGPKLLSQDHLLVYQYGWGRWHEVLALPGARDKSTRSSIIPKLGGPAMPFGMETTLEGAADFLGTGREQLVLDEYVAGADCGGTTTRVLSLDEAELRVVVQANDDCSMSSNVEGNFITLTGRYYATNAPLCCPTIEAAKATLSFQDQRWQESPAYFNVTDGANTSLIRSFVAPPN